MIGVFQPSQGLVEAIESLLEQVQLADLPTGTSPSDEEIIEIIRTTISQETSPRGLIVNTLLALNCYWMGPLSRKSNCGPIMDAKLIPANPDNPEQNKLSEIEAINVCESGPVKDLEVAKDAVIEKPEVMVPLSGSIASPCDYGERQSQVASDKVSTPQETLGGVNSVPDKEAITKETSSIAKATYGQGQSDSLAPSIGGTASVAPRSEPEAKPAPVPAPIVSRRIISHLPNARAGTDYIGKLSVDGAKILKCTCDGGSGLEWLDDQSVVKGRLEDAGDFKLIFQALVDGAMVEILAHLAVIPDPKSLWISKPSDQQDPHWKPDEDFAAINGELFCAAAGKRGRSHAREGSFRDDDFGLLSLGDGDWHIAVVADGAGSAKLSRRGSKIAVETVLKVLPELLKVAVSKDLDTLVQKYLLGEGGAESSIKAVLYNSLAQAAFKAVIAIETEAREIGMEATAYYTTLIIGACRRTPHGWFFGCFAIGDGGAAVFHQEGAYLKPLTAPDGGEFAGQTRFLLRSEFDGGYEEISKRLFFDVRKEFTVFALMTDGITDPKFATDAVFGDPEKWKQFWTDDLSAEVRLERGNDALREEFLNWMDFWSAGNHDDRTLAILVP